MIRVYMLMSFVSILSVAMGCVCMCPLFLRICSWFLCLWPWIVCARVHHLCVYEFFVYLIYDHGLCVHLSMICVYMLVSFFCLHYYGGI